MTQVLEVKVRDREGVVIGISTHVVKGASIVQYPIYDPEDDPAKGRPVFTVTASVREES